MRPAGTADPRIARGFDRLAPVYDLLAHLGSAGSLHRSQTVLLPGLPPVTRALVVGGGTGRFLGELLAGGRVEHAVSIDASPRMNRLTAGRLEALGLSRRASLRAGGLEQLRPEEQFDLVITHCFLDLFDEGELEGVVARLETALRPGGHWMFSDFATPGRGPSAWARRLVVASLYRFFRATCGINARQLPDFDRALGRAGLVRVARRNLCAGLLSASLLLKPASARA